MNTAINLEAAVVPKTHAPAAATPAIITLAAAVGTRHVVDQVWGGYTATPTGGKITVAATVNGTSVSMAAPVPTTGPFAITFDPPLQGDDNTAITITLASGGGAVEGIVNALTR